MSRQDPEMSALRLARRDKIIDAAETMFVEQGFRAATMEGAAQAAAMSKATLYGYFADKTTLFEAVAGRMADRLLEQVETALAGDGSAHEIIAEALCRKHLTVLEVVRRSSFASELFTAKSRFAATAFATLDDKIERAIAATLRKHNKPNAKSHARILFSASNGIANHAATRKQLIKDIGVLVDGLVRI